MGRFLGCPSAQDADHRYGVRLREGRERPPSRCTASSKMNWRRRILCPSEVLTGIVSAPTSFKEGQSKLRGGSNALSGQTGNDGRRWPCPLYPEKRTSNAPDIPPYLD